MLHFEFEDLVGVNGIRNHLYKNMKVTRFTDFKPLSDVESFFYNILLGTHELT